LVHIFLFEDSNSPHSTCAERQIHLPFFYQYNNTEEKTNMFPSTQYRLYAWAAMLCGLLIIIKKIIVELLLPPNAATNVVGTLGLLIGLFALTGMYFYQREANGGRLEIISYIVIWFGLGAASGADYAKNYIFLYMSKSALQALLAGPTRLVLVSSSLFFLLG